MTRCESPNGAVEFCYDFPVASTSKLPPTRPRSPRRRTLSPLPPTWALDSDSEDDEELHQPYVLPLPTRTGNQWARVTVSSPTQFAPSHLSPYEFYSRDTVTSLYEYERSAHYPFQREHQNKLRKPRSSFDDDGASYYSGPSTPSSPRSSMSDVFSDEEDGDSYAEEEATGAEGEHYGPPALKKQWAALSLRVRLGAFRAKRRMRDRVCSA